MNSCSEYRELISRLLDGELNADEQREVQRHIASCPDCAAVYDAFSMLSQAVADAAEEPPARLHEAVMADVRREAIRRRQPPKRVRSFLALAACAALVILAAANLPRMGRSATMMSAAKASDAALPMEAPQAALVMEAAEAPTEAVPEAEEAAAENSLGADRADAAYGTVQDAGAETPAEMPAPLPDEDVSPDEAAPADDAEAEPEPEPERAPVWPYVLVGVPLLAAIALLSLRGRRRR